MTNSEIQNIWLQDLHCLQRQVIAGFSGLRVNSWICIVYACFLQQVTVTTDPPSTCLSADASFMTVDGQGIFMGSVCEAIVNVTLQFDAVSALSVIPLVSDVTGNLEINSK